MSTQGPRPVADRGLPLPAGEGGGEGCARRQDIWLDPATPGAALSWPIADEGPLAFPVPRVPIDSPAGGLPRVLIGGLGYTNLRDLSVGPELVERLGRRRWPGGVLVEDVSYGPIDVLFRLQQTPRFDLGLFVAAVARGREPGCIERIEWIPRPIALEVLQSRIAEAITGVISLDNLLPILTHFGALPRRVVVFEVEPQEQDWGPRFSATVAPALDRLEALIVEEVGRVVAGR